jgi:hypothetical protein
MDALISLPVLSYFVLPSFGAYGTSLNLLFFYITWATLVLSHPPINVEAVGSLVIRFLFFIIPSTVFLIFDSILPSVAVTLKSQGADALPTRAPAGRRKKAAATTPQYIWWQVMLLAIGNLILGVALQAGVEYLFTKVFKIRSALKVTTSLPFPWAIAKDLGRGFLLREAVQYYVHRYLLHTGSTLLVSYHHQYQHSIHAPHSYVAHYDHPVIWMLWRFVPVYGAAVAFRFHLLTYFIFLALVSVEESLSFSGYNISSIILGGVARRQDLHLASGGAGNFAPWGLLDWICGTSVGNNIGDDVREEMDKHDVPERAENAWEGVKSNARERASRRKPRNH